MQSYYKGPKLEIILRTTEPAENMDDAIRTLLS